MTDDHDASADGLVTMLDIATKAGVSVSTVSRALRHDPSVALATQRRIHDIADQLDYQLNANASRLRRGRTQTVALAIPALNSWYSSQLMAGAQAVLSQNGYDTVVAVVSGPDALERILAEANPRSGRVDGVIIVDMILLPALADDLRESETTVVTTGRATPYFSSVMINDADGQRLATSHLIGLGHRKIGLIKGNDGGPYRFAVTTRRRDGFIQALTDAEITAPLREEPGNFALEGGYEAASSLVSDTDDPVTGVVCMSDQMAFGAMHALADLGHRVPDAVSVVGFDDHEMAESFGLTTIRQPVRQIGEVAAALIVEQLRGFHPAPTHQMLETELVVRRTTRRVVH